MCGKLFSDVLSFIYRNIIVTVVSYEYDLRKFVRRWLTTDGSLFCRCLTCMFLAHLVMTFPPLEQLILPEMKRPCKRMDFKLIMIHIKHNWFSVFLGLLKCAMFCAIRAEHFVLFSSRQ